jgi:hypothetical protein
MTQVPIGTMAPLCSATGMNSSGRTMVPSARVHRSSASAATVAPLRRSTIGW